MQMEDKMMDVIKEEITKEEFWKKVLDRLDKYKKLDSQIEHLDQEQRDIQIRLGVIEKTMVTKDALNSGLSNLKIDLIKWMIGLTLGNTALILTVLKTFSKF
jgi:hypothetical protein